MEDLNQIYINALKVSYKWMPNNERKLYDSEEDYINKKIAERDFINSLPEEEQKKMLDKFFE